MRSLALIVIALMVAACGTSPSKRDASSMRSPAASNAVEDASTFLVTSAATDFYAHRPPDPLQFREVRLGHFPTVEGTDQYLLCGEFLAAQDGGEAAWSPFATIQTSDFEHWLGPQAAHFCGNEAIVWDEAGDLSAELQRHIDALR